MKSLLYKLGAGVALVSVLAAQASPAFAQMVPNRTEEPSVVASEPPPPPPEAAEANTGYVMLDQFVRPCRADPKNPDGPYANCDMPRPANPHRGIDESTPVVSHARFLQDYPQAGEQGYQVIRSANSRLCDEGNEMMAEIADLNREFANSDLTYADLQTVYNALPSDIKRTTTIQTVASVGTTGALCLLSAGLYCLAAAAGGIGNIFGAQTNKRLQLANIRLSIANILVTRLNIRSNQLTLHMDAFWLDLVVPYCQRIFPGEMTSLNGTYSGSMPPLPPIQQIYGIPQR